MACKWHSKQSKKVHWNKDFCFGSKAFIQPTWISLFGIAVFSQKLLLRIQSYYSGSKAVIPDPELFLRIQIKVFTLDPKFLFWIQSYYSGSKVFTPDPKFLLWIQSYYSDRKQIMI